MTVSDAALTLPGTLRRTATVASLTNPDAGVVVPGDRAPWGRVLTESEALAARLADLGVLRDERVALLGVNSVAAVETLFACGLLGAVCVPIGPDADADEIRRVLTASGAGTVVVAGDTAAAGAPAGLLDDDVPGSGLRRVVTVGVDVPGLPRVGTEPGRPAPDRHVRPGDAALLVPAPGGPGHVLTHGALVAAARAVAGRLAYGPEDVLWDVLPLAEPSTVTALLAVLDAGGTFVTGPAPRPASAGDADRALVRIRDEGVTVAVTSTPTVLDPLLARPGFGAGFRGVRLVLDVGPPPARAVPGVVRVGSWGGPGTAGIVATTLPDDPDGAGPRTPLPGTEVAAADPDTGGPLPSGEPGELLVRGPATAVGPGATGPGDGTPDDSSWLRTGDLGVVDAHGRLYHHGRVADRIRVGGPDGEDVAAHEIENVLTAHPDVLAAVVVAAPDPQWGRVPAAFVRLRPGASATADELRGSCAASLPRFKVPRHVRFVTDWPLSATAVRTDDLRRWIADELAGEPEGAG